MSNSFPSVPASFSLHTIQYAIDITNNESGPYPYFPSGVGSAPFPATYPLTQIGVGDTSDPIINAEVSFSPAGTLGTFDQGTFESSLNTLVGEFIQVMVDYSNLVINNQGGTAITVAEIEAQTVVSRTWTWVDSSGEFRLTYTDSPSFPLS